MTNSWPPQFLYVVCQRGAEAALKREIADGPIDARPAFSRPGFVTFKLDQPSQRPDRLQLPATFARTFGYSLGHVQGELAGALAERVWRLPAVEKLLAAERIGDLHVWQRDAAVPGVRGFEPGPTALAIAAEEAVRQHAPIETLRTMPTTPRPPSRRSSWVIDVVLVEPGDWWVGCHYTNRRLDCWPGGVAPLTLPPHAVSRSYLKMQEALDWSALPMVPGDLCVELGCAPGGASQALLEHGLNVIGVDPAEVDPVVEADPRFLHVRRRAAEVPRRQLRGVTWLAADMIVAPSYTLDAVEAIVTHNDASVRGMVLTIKLTDWKLAEELPQLVERVRGWGYRDVRTRQLAFNRQELCLVALRSRGQRRVARHSRRRSPQRSRTDVPHASKPSGPHFSTKK